jgi:hypothetical protein
VQFPDYSHSIRNHVPLQVSVGLDEHTPVWTALEFVFQRDLEFSGGHGKCDNDKGNGYVTVHSRPFARICILDTTQGGLRQTTEVTEARGEGLGPAPRGQR